MNKTSSKQRQTGSRIRKLLSAALILTLLLAALPGGITAHAVSSVTYRLEITSESVASGWNKATLKIGYKSGGSSDNLDIKDELSEGKKVEWTFVRSDAVPYHLQMYLDFGGGFTIRRHSGRIKLYADGEEIMNEEYGARSYPFSSSDTTLDFGVWGVVQTELIAPDGTSTMYPTVKQAWKNAKEQDGCTVKLIEDSSVNGTLETSGIITVDLNGHLISNAETTPLFSVKSGGNLSLIDSYPTRDTGENFICTTGMTDEKEADSRIYHLTGGGIYHGGSEESGGAINVEKGGALNVTGCTFTDCHSSEGSGGAIYCEGGLNLKDTKFIFCTALEGNGGAIALHNEPDDVSLKNITFDRCSAENGGAISTTYGGKTAALSNCTFNNCQAEENGGALYCESTMSLTANKLTFNDCAAEYGGGVYNASAAPITLNESKFENCFADHGGGLAYRNGGTMTLDNAEFNNCSAEENGGGIHLISFYNIYSGVTNVWSDITVSNCNIHNCTAKENGGGVYVYDDGKPMSETVKTKLYSSAVHDNTAKTGGGVYVGSHYVYLVNSTVTNNTAEGKYGGGVYVDSMYDLDVADEIVIRYNTANGEANNLCLENGIFSSAKMYCGGLYDGAYIGISSTGGGSATVARNISQYQVNKYLHADDYERSFSMTNTKDVETKLYASMLSRNASMAVIIGGFAVIICAVGLLYFRKRRQEGKKNDGAKAEQSDTIPDKENE